MLRASHGEATAAHELRGHVERLVSHLTARALVSPNIEMHRIPKLDLHGTRRPLVGNLTPMP